MIGFGMHSSTWKPKKHCIIHPGNILIPRRDLETGEYLPGLMCPACGMAYTEVEAPTDEGLRGKFSGKQETRIISGKNPARKHYDKQGNEITDETLLKDIARGVHVIFIP